MTDKIKYNSVVMISNHNKFGGMTGRVRRITTLKNLYWIIKDLNPSTRMIEVFVDNKVEWIPSVNLTKMYLTKGRSKYWNWSTMSPF